LENQGRVRWSLVAACALLVVGLGGCPKKPAPSAAPPDPTLLESFDYAWARIAEVHPYEDMRGLDWDAVRDRHRPAAERARTRAEARLAIAAMLAELGESHYAVFSPEPVRESTVADAPSSTPPADHGASLDAEPPPERELRPPGEVVEDPVPSSLAESESDSESAKDVPDAQGEVGLEVRLVGEAVLVSRVLPGSPAARSGVGVGWEVTRIGGRETESILGKVPAGLREGSGGVLLQTHRVANRLAGRVGSEVDTVFHTPDGVQELGLVREQIGTTARFGHFPPISVRLEDALLADGRIGYIGFNVFMPAVSAQFAQSLKAHREAGIEGLIVDLRGNPGGLAGMVMGLSGWLLGDRGVSLGVMKTRDTELNFNVNPRARKDRFEGPLVVLLDGLSASTSEIFAAGLQELGRAVVVGEQSAGMSLPSLIEVLPDGDLLQFVTADLHTPGGLRVEGAGVRPDLVVPLDRDSLQAGIDPQLEAAVSHLSTLLDAPSSD